MIPDFRTRYFDSSPEHIARFVDRSLGELGIDVIDVLLLHRADHLMEPAATAEALDRVVAQGKVLMSVSRTSCRRVSSCCSRG